MASSWELLAYVSQPSDASTLTTPLFTAKKYLQVIAHTSQSTPVEPDIRFGFGASGTIDDNNNRYAVRLSLDGGSDLAQYNNLNRIYNFGYSPSGTADAITEMDIINIADKEKLANIHTCQNNNGAGNAPNRRENAAKSSNTTDQITKIQLVDLGSGASIDAGSTITVWGADDQVSTPFYPNLPNGAIFQDTTDGNHYMWDGTDTWNEVT